MFGVQRVRSTIHNWAHKADLQPEDGHDPDHVAVDKTAIRLNNEYYWLYAAVDLESNKLLHTKLEPTRTNVLLTRSSLNFARNTPSTTLCFSLMAPHR
jgi:putative transposase